MDQDRPDSSQRPLQPQWQQSPSQPLPQQPYPQYPQFQPPVYPPPPKKRGLWKFFAIGCGALVALVVIIAVIAAAVSVGSSNSSTNTSITSQATQAVQQSAQPLTQAPTPKPTQPPKWTTVQQFSGNGTKKTAIFTVPDDWKILWSCDPSSFYGGQYNLIVTVTASDNTPVDIAINTICKSGNTHDVTEEHQGGQVFLDVSSEGLWALQVQVLK